MKKEFIRIAVVLLVAVDLFSPKILLANMSIIEGRNVIDIRDYGAIGNGVADDTESIQKAMEAVGSDGATVFIPAGIYNISNTIKLQSKTKVAGQGPQSKLIMVQSLALGIFSAYSKFDISIKNIYFEGSDPKLSYPATERLIFFKNCKNIVLAENELSNTIIGIQSQSCIGVNVSMNKIHDIRHRMDFSQGYGVLCNLSCDDLTIVDNDFHSIGRHAIYVSSGSSNGIICNNKINGCESSAIGVYSKTDQSQTSNICITNNTICHVAGHVSPRGISVAVWCNNIKIKNNTLCDIQQYAIAVEGDSNAEMMRNPSYIEISRNNIKNSKAVGIWIVNASNVTVAYNFIDSVTGIMGSAGGSRSGMGAYLRRKVDSLTNVIRLPPLSGKGSALQHLSISSNRINYKKKGIVIRGGDRVKGVLIDNNRLVGENYKKNDYQISPDIELLKPLQ